MRNDVLLTNFRNVVLTFILLDAISCYRFVPMTICFKRCGCLTELGKHIFYPERPSVTNDGLIGFLIGKMILIKKFIIAVGESICA